MAYIVEGVDLDDGSRVELATFEDSATANHFMRRYIRRENAGNWKLIECYDTSTEPPSRVWFWESNPDWLPEA